MALCATVLTLNGIAMKELFKHIIVFLITLEAKLVLKKYQPKIIAITGNVGKTSTKDYIATALTGSFSVRKTNKSMNSDVGVPLTILDLPNAWYSPLAWLTNLWHGLRLLLTKHDYPEWLVLEIGADHPGDIRSICRWLTPDVVVLTRFPDVPVHVEFFSGPDEVIAEKRNLVRALKSDGLLVVNHDDPKTCSEIVRAEQKKVTFGQNPGADVLATDYHVWYDDRGMPQGIQFRVSTLGKSMPLRLPGIVGSAHIMGVVAGFAVAQALGVNLLDIAGRLAKHDLTPGRMRLLPGKHDVTLIDDSYNSSPAATEKGLAALGEITAIGRKIVVFGDMLELGSFTHEAHQEAGRHVAKVADILITVGLRAKDTAKAARESGMTEGKVMECADSVQAAKTVVALVSPGDVVLVKGSQSIRTERVVAALLSETESAAQVLVRQEQAWLAKK